MGTDLWFWQYKVKYYDDTYECLSASGLVAGQNFAEAAAALEGYYGKDLSEICSLRPVQDHVFEFEVANTDYHFDYLITQKETDNADG